jgi:hypothetical protein
MGNSWEGCDVTPAGFPREMQAFNPPAISRPGHDALGVFCRGHRQRGDESPFHRLHLVGWRDVSRHDHRQGRRQGRGGGTMRRPRHQHHGRPSCSRRLSCALARLGRHRDRHGSHHGRGCGRRPEMLFRGIFACPVPRGADQSRLPGIPRRDKQIITIRFAVPYEHGGRALRDASGPLWLNREPTLAFSSIGNCLRRAL